MKRIKLLLAAFAAMVGMSAYAQTDAQYDAAIAAIQDGGKYSIVAEYNSSSYYLKKDGYLTDKLTEAGVFTFTAASPSGAFKPTGFKTNRFTNGGAQNNSFSGDALKRIVTSGQNRDTWEAQAYFLNEEGYFAIRSTNAVSDSWGAGAYWTVVDDVDSDGLPNATYTMDDVPFVWKLQDGEIALAATAKVELAQVIAEAEAMGVSTTEANAVYENAAATSAEVNDAISVLRAAIINAQFAGASATNPVDATSFITNPAPGISGNFDGWTNSGSPGLQYQLFEYWNVRGGTTKQTLSNLPKGTYKLSAIAYTRDNMHAYLHAGDNKIEIIGVSRSVVNDRNQGNNWIAQGNGVNNLYFTLEDDTPSLEIGLTADNTTSDYWMCWRSFSLSYYGNSSIDDILLAAANADLKKVAEATASYEGKVPTGAYTALQSVVTANNKDWATMEECEAAMKAISDAVAAADALIYPYSHYKIVAAAANALDDDAEAFTGDATIDISEADADAEAATDEDAINAAILKVQGVVNTFLDAVNLNEGYRFDITNVYLENADFNPEFVNPVPGKLSMPKGWEITITGQNCGQQNRTDTNPDTKLAITNFIEAWHPSQLGSGVIAQTVKSLPEGVYVLEADASICHDPAGADDITGAGLFIKSSLKTERQAISNVRLYIKHYSLDFVHGGDGEVQFGLEANNTNANWLSADNFKVYYAGPMPLEVYEEMLGETLTAAQDYDKEVPQAAIDALMDVVDDNDKSWSSKDEYRAAIAAINAAVEATDALVAPYADYKALVKECETLQAIDNDNEAANATFQAAIESEAIEDCKTLEDIAAVKADLAKARLTYIAEANPAKGEKFDLTFMLTNPDLTALASWASAEGWYTDQADGNSQVMNNDAATSEDGTKTKFYEYWSNPAKSNNTFALYQKVNLPAGTYAISCYAFAQDQYTGANTAGVYFYANDTQGSVVKNAKLTEANIDFVNAVEQEVKIGLKTIDPNTYNWMGIGYVTLAKVAPKTIDIAENVDYEPVSEAGKVNLIRTIKADTWNTFVVPFQITNDELKAAFGDDVEVAEESEVAHGDLSTISFTKMETPAITPNKPVLLKTSTAGTAYTFEGRTIATALNDVVGTNFDFVGTYASGKIAAGDYFIGSDKLFLSDGSVNVAGTHAYLKAKAAGVKAELFIDGVATAIESIDAETAQPAGAIYNVAGQRVQKAQRGLYIMGGKKVVVK